jgi:Tfp pilus assembly protein PilF
MNVNKLKYAWCISCLFVLWSCGPTLEQQQQAADSQYQLGIAEFNRGNLGAALGAFEKALEYYPQDPKCHNAIGLIYLQQKQYQKALSMFKKTLSLDPHFTEAHNNLGNTYAQIGDWDKAITEFKEALSDPFYRTPALAHYNLGLALMERQLQGDMFEAVKEFHAAVQLEPNFSRALDKYGIALYRVNRNQEAIKQFKRAIEVDPQFIDPYLNLGMVYMKQGNKEEAIAQFKLVVERATEEKIIEEATRYLGILE